MDLPVELLESLQTLQPSLLTLRAVLRSPFPPRSIFIRATSNASLAEQLVRASLPTSAFTDLEAAPHIQQLLPQACFVDCAELAGQKALYGRILNTLSGWGHGRWDDEVGGVLSWNGAQEGYDVVRSDAEDGAKDAWSIRWNMDRVKDYNSRTAERGIMGERRDESMSSFLGGLREIFKLGESTACTTPRRTRFVILQNAERLAALESLAVGQTEGTLVAVVLRLAELTGMPICPIFITSTEWLLMRPQRGATEPAVMAELPLLSQKDLETCIKSWRARYVEEDLTPHDSQDHPSYLLFDSLVTLTLQTFEAYVGDELQEYAWLLEKLWPRWLECSRSYAHFNNDVNRLVGVFKPVLSLELEELGSLRALQMQGTGAASIDTAANGISAFEQTVLSTPTKQIASKTKSSLSVEKGSASKFYPTTPKRTQTGTQPSSAASSLALSLPVLSRYLVIAAFLASSNPARRDMLMLATEEDELLASKRRKKKGGGTRKTPNKSSVLGRDGQPKKEPIPQRLLGPKAFPIERLLAVCEAILPVDMRPLARSPAILQQIAALTNIRLLQRTTTASHFASQIGGPGATSAFEKLDGLKLKCGNLELETVELLGKSIGFKVGERLWESV